MTKFKICAKIDNTAPKAIIPNIKINGAKQQPKHPRVGPNVNPNKVNPVAFAVVLGPISVSFIKIVYNNKVKNTRNISKGNPPHDLKCGGLVHLEKETKTK